MAAQFFRIGECGFNASIPTSVSGICASRFADVAEDAQVSYHPTHYWECL